MTMEPAAFRVGERLFCSLYSAGLYASEMKLTVEPLYRLPESEGRPDYNAERESHITDYMQDQINYYVKELADKSKWVACSERMPNDHEPVLTWDGMYKRVHFTMYGHWQCWDAKRITYWIPLPAAPKPEK